MRLATNLFYAFQIMLALVQSPQVAQVTPVPPQVVVKAALALLLGAAKVNNQVLQKEAVKANHPVPPKEVADLNQKRALILMSMTFGKATTMNVIFRETESATEMRLLSA